jgi:hypothetical protein
MARPRFASLALGAAITGLAVGALELFVAGAEASGSEFGRFVPYVGSLGLIQTVIDGAIGVFVIWALWSARRLG